ncbi:uncharacterized protein LOC125234632 [Leguminivora glycinivorella]|uniref:uncharacterized protein LOC125234632 n=1 Tax=Leguminivora glycinivorella TaxID=1035111 RepID=UPI00200E61A0|nr:uncharacterized protein LOC125234632 [Leguminivora glycinivorella]
MSNLLQSTAFNYKEIIIEEIALDGLTGTSCKQLWKHMENRISAPVTDKMKARFWQFISNCSCITFYKVPEPAPCIDILDRFMIVEEHSGHLLDPEDFLDGPYEYCPVENNFGSCHNYNTRKEIRKDKIQALSYEEVMTEYGDTMVMVASSGQRWKALSPHMPETVRAQLTPVHYCILELVGKGRYNGQMTVGKTNLTKIVKESKLLFYNRKHLQSLGLINVTTLTIKTQDKGIKSIILRLKRFHKPTIMSVPKVGNLFKVIDYLKQQPDFCDKTDVVISKGFITQQNSRRLQKTINVFKFDEKLVQPDPNTKKGKAGIAVKRRFISLIAKSDESSQSEDEDNVDSLECQYKVGVDLLRQAYERLLEAGLKGLTQIELSQLLGVEFYTSRSICRIFKARHIIREYLEDRGKQRTARYYAIAAATSEMDQKYEEEKNKLLKYVKETKRKLEKTSTNDVSEQDEDEIPLKKIKLSKEASNEEASTSTNIDNEVTEIKVLDGLENHNSESLLCSKKNPTLRQLKFANGLLKITREKLAVSGYQTLSGLVAKESGEPPLDTKALKIFVQKLVTDGQLKLMKVKWPAGPRKHSILICAPHVKCTDPIIKQMQKEIEIKAFTNNKVKKEIIEPTHRPISQYAYPRYMKIQLLHEFLFELIYCNDEKIEFHLPPGFASLVNVIPEISIEFAIGNISNSAITEITHLKVEHEHLKLKLRDAPPELYKVLLQSKSLQSSIRTNLKVLAMLGLIQLVIQPSSNAAEVGVVPTLSAYSFYLNRTAKVIDTTGTWPRLNADKEALEKTFYFETLDDVKNYWNEVYEISTHTTIEYADRGRKKLEPPVRKVDEVQLYDNGEVFGDGAGPCGFDSCFYMDLSRFWKAFYIRIIKNKPIKKYESKPTRKKKIVEKKPPKKIVKVRKKRRENKPRDQQLHPRIKVPQRRPADPVVKWSAWEDTIINMCKVAITILSPIAQPGCLKVRNTAAKDLLSIFDTKKIASVCHRRAMALEANMTLQHEKECLLNELRRRRDLLVQYEGLLKRLRIKHCTNMTRFVNAARIPMFELVWLLNQLVNNKYHLKRVPCVAMDIDDFHRKYKISATTVNNPCNIYRAGADNLALTKVKETIILSLMGHLNTSPSSISGKIVYAILKEFPERSLRIGLDQLRKSGAVACVNKVLNYHLHRLDIQNSVQASYKISAAYQRRWINRLNTEFSDILAEVLESSLPQNQIKASPEINCMLCEFQSCGLLEITSVTLPVITGPSGSIIHEQQLNVLDIEMKFKLKSGIVGWKKTAKYDRFTDYFDMPFEELPNIMHRQGILPETNKKADTNDNIVRHLKNKGEEGAVLSELLVEVEQDSSVLTKRLEDLQSKNIITQVGYYENRVILTEFAKTWTIQLGDHHVIPTPWRTLTGEVRYDVFFKWAGVIVNKVFELPACNIAFLSSSYEYLTTRSVQEICTFLEKCRCVELKVLRTPELDLFTKDEPSEFTDYNPFEAPEDIYVYPVKDSLTRYAFVRKTFLSNQPREVKEMKMTDSEGTSGSLKCYLR